MNYNPIQPRTTLEAAVALIGIFVAIFWGMIYSGVAILILNYAYSIQRCRHQISFDRFMNTKPKQKEMKANKLSEAEEKMQTLLDDRGFPATVIGSIDSHRRIIFEVKLPKSFNINKLSADVPDLQRATGVKPIMIEPSVMGKPGVSRIMLPKLKEPKPLMLEDLIASDEFKASHRLALPIGQNIEGKTELRRLDKMPHILVGGTTGGGKSVQVNCWITSLICKNTPEQLQLILIDPKMLELNIYERSKHLAMPVVTRMEEAKDAILMTRNEMEYRYELMSHFKVRNVSEFNKKIGNRKVRNPLWRKDVAYEGDEAIISACEEYLTPLPTLVMVIDEMADLVLRFREVEDLIATLAGKARASGIHLIPCTQNPLTKVVTSLIKANIATRFALQTASIDDSQTLLGKGHTEASYLLGNGDGYLLDGNKSVHVQGYLIEADEIEAIIDRQNKVAA